ncbi:site-2 protease family protein [Chroococcidiopsis sp. FACHB-1243]|uniref:site-2 protease family protein n=1 Tax=Chroococcidiopsis sp. [FACHB-1243] TaxID=2692781 RepID=UPI00178670C2|nr:site-2 protease family protein [Chroococcidiopsis sp. [FACHB-1243]]MBD2307729.1 site-2 protease family protein [Chroococcidiopsis sp. [FACHB-1243]]
MQSFRLGSISGFEIRVDLSWFLIFFLILWTFIGSVFPGNYPGLSQGTYIVMGVVTTLLFFASLLAHELSHSFVARAKGISVEGITLFAFGGVSRTRMEAETAGDEFQIAGVGPLTSVAIAVLFGLLYWIGTAAGWSVAVNGVTGYLASINLILAIFNLLPGFPLDGGRLFRATVWKITGNLKKATRIASWGGKFFSYLIIALGVVQLFGGLILNGLWLIFIGWFLNNAADYSYQQLVVRASLEGVRVRDLMTPAPETVPPNLMLRELVDEYFLRQRYQAYPVTEGDRLLGIITLNRVKDIPREEWHSRAVADTMISVEQGIVSRPEENMTQVLEKMAASGVRRVLVVRDGKLEGIVTANDIASWLRRRRDLGEKMG